MTNVDKGNRWQSQRGHEWWYSAPGFSASGEFVPGSSAFSIGSVGAASPATLRTMLLHTLEQFPGTEPRILITAATRPVIAALAEAGTIEWQELMHPFSVEARITAVR